MADAPTRAPAQRRPLPSREYLAECLVYDPATGGLRWRERPLHHFAGVGFWRHWNGRYAGQSAFTAPDGSGYLCGSVGNRRLMAHRVIWGLLHGDPGEDEIDHIDGDRANNRAANLRRVSGAINRLNSSLPRDNRSGAIGVCFHAERRRWRAFITIRGVTKQLGYFATRDEAVAARKAAEAARGFHPNHGKPARALTLSSSNARKAGAAA